MQRVYSSGCILFRREKEKIKYLLLRYSINYWGLVKGHIEKGETKEETLVREIKEETGIAKIKFISGFKHRTYYFFRQGKKLNFKEVTFFLIETNEKKVKLSSEHIGYKWLEFEDAYKQLTYKNTKNVLKKAHLFLNKKIR